MLITCSQDLEDLWSLNMLSVMNHRLNDEFLIENWTRADKKRIFLAFYLLKTLFNWNEMKPASLCQFFVQIFLKKKGETYRKKVDFPKSQLMDKSHALFFEKKIWKMIEKSNNRPLRSRTFPANNLDLIKKIKISMNHSIWQSIKQR